MYQNKNVDGHQPKGAGALQYPTGEGGEATAHLVLGREGEDARAADGNEAVVHLLALQHPNPGREDCLIFPLCEERSEELCGIDG